MTKFNNLTPSNCIINMLVDNTINLVVGNAVELLPLPLVRDKDQ